MHQFQGIPPLVRNGITFPELEAIYLYYNVFHNFHPGLSQCEVNQSTFKIGLATSIIVLPSLRF